MIVCEIQARLASFWQPAIDFTLNSQFYHQFGLLVVFLYSMTPSIVMIPNESFWVPIYNMTMDDQKSDFLFRIWLLTTVGGWIGDSIIYFATLTGVRFFRKKEMAAEKEMGKWLRRFHKHKHWIFLASPSLFGIGDSALIYAGYNRIRYDRIALWNFLGNGIRNAWGIALIISGTEVFKFLC